MTGPTAGNHHPLGWHLFVGSGCRPWTPAVGAFLGLFLTIGLLIRRPG
jgi:hypothetical protein